MAQYNTNSFVWQALFLSVYRKNSTKNNRCGSLNKSPQGKEKVPNFSGVGVVLVPSLNQKVSKSHGDRHDKKTFRDDIFTLQKTDLYAWWSGHLKKIWVFLLTRNKVLVLNLKTQEATLDLCLYLYKNGKFWSGFAGNFSLSIEILFLKSVSSSCFSCF